MGRKAHYALRIFGGPFFKKMIEVKINKWEFDSGNLIVRNVTTNLIYALFNSRNSLKGVYNMSSKFFLDSHNAVLKNLNTFLNEYIAEGEDIIEQQIISAMVIGGDYCGNRQYNDKIVRIQQNLSDLALEYLRMATGIKPVKYKPKNSDWMRAIKDIEIISMDRIVEKIKTIPKINNKKPDFYSMGEYHFYLTTLLIKKP